MSTITFAEAGAQMLAGLREKNKVKAATLRSVDYHLSAIGASSLASVSLADITGRDVKTYLDACHDAGLSGATVRGRYRVIVQVIGSVVDENLNCVHPIRWKTENLDLPSAKPSQDRTLATPTKEIEKAVAANRAPFSALVAFLAFTGCRLGEACACRIGTALPAVTHWDADERIIVVKTAIDVGDEHAAKTDHSANRIVDLSEAANDFLLSYVGERSEGFLFTRNGGALRRSDLYRALKKLDLSVPYHGLRRARITHLYSKSRNDADSLIIRFWAGHESHEKTQTEKYVKLHDMPEHRREFAEYAGLGFKLPRIAAPVPELETVPA